MVPCLNAVGFVFDKVKTYIKKDKSQKYIKYFCQECAWINKKNTGCGEPIAGMIMPCNKCTSNTQYKICIFKLKKEHFISSSLGIATTFNVTASVYVSLLTSDSRAYKVMRVWCLCIIAD